MKKGPSPTIGNSSPTHKSTHASLNVIWSRLRPYIVIIITQTLTIVKSSCWQQPLGYPRISKEQNRQTVSAAHAVIHIVTRLRCRKALMPLIFKTQIFRILPLLRLEHAHLLDGASAPLLVLLLHGFHPCPQQFVLPFQFFDTVL